MYLVVSEITGTTQLAKSDNPQINENLWLFWIYHGKTRLPIL